MDSNIYSAPEANVEKSTVFCRECGEKISALAITCNHCGQVQNTGGKSKVAAGLLGIFLGGLRHTPLLSGAVVGDLLSAVFLDLDSGNYRVY